MDASYYQEFAVLAETCNYSEAADRLALSDSALSRHIKAMEGELGVPLFYRTSRSVKLSEYGKLFLPYAQHIAECQQRAARDLEKARRRLRNTITLGSLYYIDDMLSAFHLHNAGIVFSYCELSNDGAMLAEQLRRRQCEVAFAPRLDDRAEEFISVLYETDYYDAVLPKGHPLAQKTSLSLSDLAQEDFISFTPGAFGDLNLRRFCQEAGFEPHIVYTAAVGMSIADLVQNGMGVSILQRKTMSKRRLQSIVMVRIEPPISIDVYMTYCRNVPLSPAAKKFVAFVRDVWPNRTKQA